MLLLSERCLPFPRLCTSSYHHHSSTLLLPQPLLQCLACCRHSTNTADFIDKAGKQSNGSPLGSHLFLAFCEWVSQSLQILQGPSCPLGQYFSITLALGHLGVLYTYWFLVPIPQTFCPNWKECNLDIRILSFPGDSAMQQSLGTTARMPPT